MEKWIQSWYFLNTPRIKSILRGENNNNHSLDKKRLYSGQSRINVEDSVNTGVGSPQLRYITIYTIVQHKKREHVVKITLNVHVWVLQTHRVNMANKWCFHNSVHIAASANIQLHKIGFYSWVNMLTQNFNFIHTKDLLNVFK